ncbi:MAG: 3-oxoacyl-[acyl-carrier-protein] synthase III C-terminal domain-containing protein [bacterium]|nr:3-oxoacyl-[acyl-carrier-protein] synthase III C-terminal domain-containing protein [bacterium]
MRWIRNIRTWVPKRYSQDELLTIFGLKNHELARRIFAKSAIEHRHTMIDPTHPFSDDTHLQLPEFEEMFSHLTSRDQIIEVSNLRALPLKHTSPHYHLHGKWCVGAIYALEMTAKRRDRSSVLTVDINSQLRWLPDFQDANDVVAFALFGDGVACADVEDASATEASTPRILDFSYLHDREAPWVRYQQGKLFLNRDLPRQALPLIESCIGKLLGEHGIAVKDVNHWIVHPGGRKILDNIGASLGIEEHLNHSRAILAGYGNIGASSLLFILKEVMETRPTVGSYGLMVGFGPGQSEGFSAGCCLIQW